MELFLSILIGAISFDQAEVRQTEGGIVQ